VNVDLADTDPSSNPLYDVLVDAIVGLPSQQNAVIYMHRKSLALLRKLASDKTNVNFNPDAPFGRGFAADIDGMPIKIIDEIAIDESIVS
jgi:HK97 family phage major capsid protein